MHHTFVFFWLGAGKDPEQLCCGPPVFFVVVVFPMLRGGFQHFPFCARGPWAIGSHLPILLRKLASNLGTCLTSHHKSIDCLSRACRFHGIIQSILKKAPNKDQRDENYGIHQEPKRVRTHLLEPPLPVNGERLAACSPRRSKRRDKSWPG